MKILMEKQLPDKDKDFTKLYHIVVDSGIWASLTPKAKALLNVHLRHADYKTRIGRPTIPTLAEEAGINKGSVFKGNTELCRAGLMKMWKKDRRWYYHLYKKEDIHPKDTGIYPPKVRKKPLYRQDAKSGRFISPKGSVVSSPNQADKPLPENTDIPKPESIGTILETTTETIK